MDRSRRVFFVRKNDLCAIQQKGSEHVDKQNERSSVLKRRALCVSTDPGEIPLKERKRMLQENGPREVFTNPRVIYTKENGYQVKNTMPFPYREVSLNAGNAASRGSCVWGDAEMQEIFLTPGTEKSHPRADLGSQKKKKQNRGPARTQKRIEKAFGPTMEGQWKPAKATHRQRRKTRLSHLILGLIVLLLVGGILWQIFPGGGWNTNVSGVDPLVLVNKDHAFPEDCEVQLHWLNNGNCAVAEEMYEPLRKMLSDGTDAGGTFVVASGHRTREYQQELLEEDIQRAMMDQGLSWQEAYDQESRETMPPGHSEHETGLAVDIVSLDYQVLDRAQADTFENQWLFKHCSDYGFILRYPEGKEEITGIDYEPWHFRYVGKKAAKQIMRRGITLEEYLAQGE